MRVGALAALAGGLGASTGALAGQQSVARQWNEQLLEAIRNDFARPTVHARNLFHLSVAMWDAWAAYDAVADQWLHHEKLTAPDADGDHDVDAIDIKAAREKAISFASYRILKARFAISPGADEVLPQMDALMDALGYDKDFKGTIGSNPAALGNRIAISVLALGLNDNANEAGGFGNLFYSPVNEPLLPGLAGNPQDLDGDGKANDYVLDPNRWQPLALDFFVDQNGNVIIGGYPGALSPEWGMVTPFSLNLNDLTIYPHPDPDFDWWVYHDPGPPPQLGGDGEAYYKWGFEMVSIWQSHLDPADGVLWDISPGGLGNAPIPGVEEWEEYFDRFEGGGWGKGHPVNPVTGQPYAPQLVPRGDYARILAEFWADGPDSEAPPGHWHTIANYVADHALTVKQFEGEGPVIDDLQWDVKVYLAMGGAMHDVAVSVWGIKGYYDFVRPISAIRYMCGLGQCSSPQQPSFHPLGVNLSPGFIEVVTAATTAPGQRHAHLIGNEGKIALYTWRGPDYIPDPETTIAGVGWILAENWWPYQRPTFVSPPFPGYTSGHSAYSSAGAEVLELFTGSPYFPGGLGEFVAPQNEFLVFEEGPSVNCVLQWATYDDAAEQSAQSRIWGGIHPPCDDIPSRHIGKTIGPEAFNFAKLHYGGRISCPADLNADRTINVQEMIIVILGWNSTDQDADVNLDGTVNVQDLIEVILGWGDCP
jgi:hypothetical protein